MASKYMTQRECEIRDKSTNDKLDLILENQRRYEDTHAEQHKAITDILDDYRASKNKAIGAGRAIGIISGVLGGLVTWFLGKMGLLG